MIDIENIIEKFENHVIENVDKDNMNKIISFLKNEGCNFIDELIEDYLDLFTFTYKEFIKKYTILNIKYNNNLLNEIESDMNILEEFFTV